MVLAMSCQKEYDNPPITELKAGQTISMENLIGMYAGNPIKFDSTYSLYATVTMDETDGNLYKNVYIQDGNFALNLRTTSGGGLYVGDSIRIDLNGTTLSTYNGVLQLDSVNVDKNIVKIAVDQDAIPTLLTLDLINANLQSRLIKVENVQFIVPELGMTYADKENNESVDITIEDCNGNTMLVRTSGYSSFANEKIAQGNGSIVLIVGVFNSDIQLYIRSFKEINLNGDRCEGQVIVKNFNDDEVNSGGWQVQQVIGNDTWVTNDQGASSSYCQISNFNGANNACESWLISPSIDLSTITAPKLHFLNASNYSGPNLEVFVSTEYSGTGNPNDVNWVNLSPVLSAGGWDWVNSGQLDLSSYSSTNTHIAFKYTGTTSNGKTWEIDDIIIIGSL